MQKGLSDYLGRAFSGTFMVYGAGVALAFAVQVLLTRLLGAAEYGDYYFVLAWLMALLIVAKFGLDSALLRFVPAYIAQQQWGMLRGIVRWSARRAALASLTTAVALALTVSLLPDIGSRLAVTFYLGSAALPILVYIYLRSALLRSLRHVVLALLPEAVIAPLVLALAIVVYWSWAAPVLTSADAMAATLVGLLVSAAVGRQLLLRRLPAQLLQTPAQTDARTWLTSTRSMLLITGAHVLLANTDAIMLGMLKDPASVGIYAVAAKCAILVSFPLTIANTTIAPLIPQFHASDDHAQLQQALDHSMRLVSLAALCAFGVLLLAASPLLSMFGEEFVAGNVALWILGFSALINALAGPVANLLSLTGSERYVSRVMIGTMLLNVTLNLLLIPRWGIEGAAVATGLSMMTWNVLMFVASRKRLGLNPNGWIFRPVTGR